MLIGETLSALGDFEILLLALTESGLAPTLAEAGPFTVFAPVDDAFDFYLILEDMDLETFSQREDLTDILLNHVVSGLYTFEDIEALVFSGVYRLEALSGEQLSIDSMFGTIFIENAWVMMPDVAALNGIIHIVAAVIEVYDFGGEDPFDLNDYNSLIGCLDKQHT